MEKERARKCICFAASEFEFQIMHRLDMFCVNLNERTCTCKKWDLTGIPCLHVISCCNWLRVPPESFVLDWFKKEKYLQSYNISVKPINGERHWEKIEYVLNPPPVKIGAGRPKKNRRKEAHERFDKKGKLSKHGVQMTCTICNGNDHNKRKCPQKGNISYTTLQKPPAKPRGRPRKDGGPSKKSTDPNQPKRPRGRPLKATNSTTGVPNGWGVFYGEDAGVYINPGQRDANILSGCPNHLLLLQLHINLELSFEDVVLCYLAL